MPDASRSNDGSAPISALICTRHRGASIVATVQSLLANRHPHFECLVVDQSEDASTQAALAPFVSDPRLHYIRSQTVGKGRALNLGMQRIQSEIIALTDDDCEVPPDWLEKIEAAFTADPQIGAVFCDVWAAEHDSNAGFIPAFHCGEKRMLTHIGDGDVGIGAGYAVRRSSVERVGGFDESLGPGARFPSGDEVDLASRILLAGGKVVLTDETHTVHYGFRTWEEGKALTFRDCSASGAVCSKQFRSGRPGTRLIPLRVTWHLTRPVLRDLLRFKRPQGLKRSIAFLRGFFTGLRVPLQRDTLLFAPEVSAASKELSAEPGSPLNS